VNAVITWLKTLKYLNEFPHLSMLSLTLRNAYAPHRTAAPSPARRRLQPYRTLHARRRGLRCACALRLAAVRYYPTFSFLIMFFIIFVGCGQAFNMSFGPYLPTTSRHAASNTTAGYTLVKSD